jgi:hypothetical protein
MSGIIGGYPTHFGDVQMCAPTSQPGLTLVQHGAKEISPWLIQIVKPTSGQDAENHCRYHILCSSRAYQDGGISDQVVSVLPINRFVVHTSTTRGMTEWLH